jgi:hypothetical protein
VVAVLEVVEVEVVVVGVVEVVDVLVDVDVEVVVVDKAVVVGWLDVVCWWQSLRARAAIVPAPWVRLLRSVELTVTGRVCTSLPRTALALRAAPQLPACTAETIWPAWPLSASD